MRFGTVAVCTGIVLSTALVPSTSLCGVGELPAGTILIDRHQSAIMGAQNLMAANDLVFYFEDRYIGTQWFPEDFLLWKLLGAGLRYYVKYFYVDYFAYAGAMLVQHEYFGHAARMREFGVEDYRVVIRLNLLSGGGGVVYYDASNLSQLERQMVTMGGSEANTVSARHLRRKFMERGYMNYYDAVRYYSGIANLPVYVLSSDTFTRPDDWGTGDVRHFVKTINYRYGHYWPLELTVKELKEATRIYLADPFAYVMLYTFLKKHVWDGHRGMSIPMIPIGGTKYLPSFYLGLSPFGYEYYWENNFLTENYLSSLYFRLGSGPFADTWGLGFDIDQVGGASELGRPRLGLHVDF